MSTSTDLPYRPNVGIALFNREGKLFLAQRADLPGHIWQCPQGGIDEGENLEQAAWREMMEEIGTNKAVLLAMRPGWVSYDLPPHLLGRSLGGRYRGQKQRWLVFGFTGKDSDFNLGLQTPPEFNDWRWVGVREALDGHYDLGIKRKLYETLLPELKELFDKAPQGWWLQTPAKPR
ncbi:RNA pyrophosphohydrolase [Oecophyllibacter saccharovorans]|uniref:RNA pyrophosphohydrolase n=1 Tax=Oecophyllibacter saccharovorans TaxID=2558360 RepID=A0A506URK0_9PROT|nr:RNA pyrophosphohydrolase [Oecophyllibacter saccharovorans]TPW35909.1 RNA pyrophosphohydrolase [Oecophyllibacter saccharovorans]